LILKELPISGKKSRYRESGQNGPGVCRGTACQKSRRRYFDDLAGSQFSETEIKNARQTGWRYFDDLTGSKFFNVETY
jgi:hypothetical protein